MNIQTKIYVSESHNPWFNLATEEWIFQDLNDVDQVLFLWRNSDTVVIGRSQNPWLECNLEKMKQDDVRLARRQSGGGAVYHDLGNTNFTFLSKKSGYDKKRNLSIITSALQSIGVDTEFSGRNDIVTCEAEPRKVSGNAFKEKADRAFHHGTLLLDADLTRLNDYLNPNKKKLEAKGVTSVRSRVTNLKQLHEAMTHDNVCEQIIAKFRQCYDSDVDITLLSPQQLQKIESLEKHYQHLQSWDWLYGQTLEFTHHFDCRFDWGVVDVQLVVKNGMIEQAKIYTDALQPEWLEEYALTLQSRSYDEPSIAVVSQMVFSHHSSEAPKINDFQEWFVQQIQ
ncbi:MAG: lipoate--protein ligase [Coxiellaceae bacterium]|nr:lipoate--protein ligase [Coxiellaceae bacterium]